MDEKKDVVAQEVEATETDSTQEEQATEAQAEEAKQELIRQLKLKVDGKEEVMELPFEVQPEHAEWLAAKIQPTSCLLYTSPSPRDRQKSRMPSSA